MAIIVYRKGENTHTCINARRAIKISVGKLLWWGQTVLVDGGLSPPHEIEDADVIYLDMCRDSEIDDNVNGGC